MLGGGLQVAEDGGGSFEVSEEVEASDIGDDMLGAGKENEGVAGRRARGSHVRGGLRTDESKIDSKELGSLGFGTAATRRPLRELQASVATGTVEASKADMPKAPWRQLPSEIGRADSTAGVPVLKFRCGPSGGAEALSSGAPSGGGLGALLRQPAREQQSSRWVADIDLRLNALGTEPVQASGSEGHDVGSAEASRQRCVAGTRGMSSPSFGPPRASGSGSGSAPAALGGGGAVGSRAGGASPRGEAQLEFSFAGGMHSMMSALSPVSKRSPGSETNSACYSPFLMESPGCDGEYLPPAALKCIQSLRQTAARYDGEFEFAPSCRPNALQRARSLSAQRTARDDDIEACFTPRVALPRGASPRAAGAGGLRAHADPPMARSKSATPQLWGRDGASSSSSSGAPSLYERGEAWLARKRVREQVLRREKLENETCECTFRPAVSSAGGVQTPRSVTEDRARRLFERQLSWRQSLEEERARRRRERQEVEEAELQAQRRAASAGPRRAARRRAASCGTPREGPSSTDHASGQGTARSVDEIFAEFYARSCLWQRGRDERVEQRQDEEFLRLTAAASVQQLPPTTTAAAEDPAAPAAPVARLRRGERPVAATGSARERLGGNQPVRARPGVAASSAAALLDSLATARVRGGAGGGGAGDPEAAVPRQRAAEAWAAATATVPAAVGQEGQAQGAEADERQEVLSHLSALRRCLSSSAARAGATAAAAAGGPLASGGGSSSGASSRSRLGLGGAAGWQRVLRVEGARLQGAGAAPLSTRTSDGQGGARSRRASPRPCSAGPSAGSASGAAAGGEAWPPPRRQRSPSPAGAVPAVPVSLAGAASCASGPGGGSVAAAAAAAMTAVTSTPRAAAALAAAPRATTPRRATTPTRVPTPTRAAPQRGASPRRPTSRAALERPSSVGTCRPAARCGPSSAGATY
mmetsp:Transcript_119468/g.381146  ORF Transcript_119468/g.381146 Transcript_119468/m.381146 type:complete len:934 (+) Transcript_119468:105-2906(+)